MKKIGPQASPILCGPCPFRLFANSRPPSSKARSRHSELDLIPAPRGKNPATDTGGERAERQRQPQNTPSPIRWWRVIRSRASPKSLTPLAKQLKKLNHLTTSTVKPGQVLQIGFREKAPNGRPSATTPQAKPITSTSGRQPVQDFDIPGLNLRVVPGFQLPRQGMRTRISSAPARGGKSPLPIAKLFLSRELAGR